MNDRVFRRLRINPDEIEKEIRDRGFLDLDAYQVTTSEQEILDFFNKSHLLLESGSLDETCTLRFNENKLSFYESTIDAYVVFCKKKKRTPEKPFSGNLLLRVSPEIHKEATIEAKNRGISLNAFLNEVISKEIHKPHTTHRKRA